MRSRPKMTSQVSKENGTEARECLLNSLIYRGSWTVSSQRQTVPALGFEIEASELESAFICVKPFALEAVTEDRP